MLEFPTWDLNFFVSRSWTHFFLFLSGEIQLFFFQLVITYIHGKDHHWYYRRKPPWEPAAKILGFAITVDLNFLLSNVKVHIFWEGHKILRNLHLTFDYSTAVKSKGKISQNFVAFSEYMNFNWTYSVKFTQLF